MYSIQLGPSLNPSPLEQRKDFIRWWIFSISGKIARVGSKSFGDDRWPDAKAQEELEKAYKGKLVALVIEPAYEHGGQFDPGGGFIWEEDYAEWQLRLHH